MWRVHDEIIKILLLLNERPPRVTKLVEIIIQMWESQWQKKKIKLKLNYKLIVVRNNTHAVESHRCK